MPKYPSIPEPHKDLNSLYASVMALKQIVEIMLQMRGSQDDGVVSFRELMGFDFSKATGLSKVAVTGEYTDLSGSPALGTAASKDVGTSDGNVVGVQAGGKLPALSGEDLTGVVKPSDLVANIVSATYTANANITTVIPLDNTIPQVSEGTEILSVSITPRAIGNKIRILFQGQFSSTGGEHAVAALFKNGEANAVAARHSTVGTSGYGVPIVLEHMLTTTDTSPITLSIRIGPTTTDGIRLNGSGSAQLLGGVSAATLVAEELRQ